MADASLGAPVATYRTDNRRRATMALILLPVGAVVTVLAVLLWILVAAVAARSAPTGPDPEMLPAVVLGLGVAALLLGVIFAVLYHTRRDESFTVHEHGLLHSRAGRTVPIRWSDLARVTVGPGKDNPVSRWAGGDVYCLVTLTDGRKLAINGLTENARQLVREVQAHAPTAGHTARPGTAPGA